MSSSSSPPPPSVTYECTPQGQWSVISTKLDSNAQLQVALDLNVAPTLVEAGLMGGATCTPALVVGQKAVINQVTIEGIKLGPCEPTVATTSSVAPSPGSSYNDVILVCAQPQPAT